MRGDYLAIVTLGFGEIIRVILQNMESVGGTSYGSTDELGYHAAVDVVHVNDLHATMLHLLGIDHRRLTFRFQGRDFRLTDVAGNVIKPILS